VGDKFNIVELLVAVLVILSITGMILAGHGSIEDAKTIYGIVLGYVFGRSVNNPPGPQGERGPQGYQGERGRQGYQGERGRQEGK
jgi:hypothetical protein